MKIITNNPVKEQKAKDARTQIAKERFPESIAKIRKNAQACPICKGHFVSFEDIETDQYRNSINEKKYHIAFAEYKCKNCNGEYKAKIIHGVPSGFFLSKMTYAVWTICVATLLITPIILMFLPEKHAGAIVIMHALGLISGIPLLYYWSNQHNSIPDEEFENYVSNLKKACDSQNKNGNSPAKTEEKPLMFGDEKPLTPDPGYDDAYDGSELLFGDEEPKTKPVTHLKQAPKIVSIVPQELKFGD